MPNNDKIRQLHDQLIAQVEALVDSHDWRRFLAVAARFHRYSANNVMLILAQAPQSTRVAGYRRWQSLGRQVRRGEGGIAILAPCVYRQRPLGEAEAEAVPGLARILRGFRIAYVWDITQTDGASLPDCSPILLAGGDPAGLWSAIAPQVDQAGFTLRRGDCGGANGLTDHVARKVVVRDDVDSAQAAKTLIHELAHVLLHGDDHRRCRGVVEVEAESVAYIVCGAAGMASADYSLPYVTRWSGGDPAVVRRTADRVITTARRILDGAGLLQHDETMPADFAEHRLGQVTC